MSSHDSPPRRSTPHSRPQLALPAAHESPLPAVTDTGDAPAAQSVPPARSWRTRNLALAVAVLANLAGALLLALAYPKSSAQDAPDLWVTDTIDMATLRVYQTSQSNANGLTLASHGVLAPWTDSQANRVQRQSGVNWQVAGMGAGSDYAAPADGTTELTGIGSAWVELDVTAMVRAWIANPADNHGLVLLAQAASGSVNYGVCSELGWSPCAAAQAPVLKVWHYPPPPIPEPEP